MSEKVRFSQIQSQFIQALIKTVFTIIDDLQKVRITSYLEGFSSTRVTELMHAVIVTYSCIAT